MTRSFYDPTPEQIGHLSTEPWCCSYSGGKDSTALVTWIEWLRRSSRIAVSVPLLVRSDTGVEEPPLMALAEQMTDLLTDCGWRCAVVRPEVSERLYPQILGRGLQPIHPGVRRMRWCTRSTKIDPMERWKDEAGARLSITGLRLGESAMRDGKLKKAGCAAGGECGIPDAGEGRYSPILHWTTCQVIDWLQGHVSREVGRVMADVFQLTRQLVKVYGITMVMNLFDEEEITRSARFGCIGCPAIGAEAQAPRSVLHRNGKGSPLNELYDVWHEAREQRNRLIGFRRGKAIVGALRMAARQRLFVRVMDIQARSGVTLVTPGDEAFIRQCWAEQVYPRGWSAADEMTEMPFGPLFEE